MNIRHLSSKRWFKYEIVIVSLMLMTVIAGFAWARARGPQQDAPAKHTGNSLLDGYRHVEGASVSDAIEQLTGKKMYIPHRMRPTFPTKFAGYTLTGRLKRQAIK